MATFVSDARVYKITFAGLNQSFPYFNAYDYDRDSNAPPNPPNDSSPPSGAREFSDTNYQQISYFDGSMASPGYETHYFIFKLPVDAATDQVTVNWYGQAQDGNDLVEFYAFNFDSNSWSGVLTSITGGPAWINYTFTNPDPYISANGYIHLAFVGDPEGLFDGDGTPSTDYIELIVTVGDSYVQTACVQIVSENIRDWDGFLDSSNIQLIARATTTGGSIIPWYYNFSLKAEWSYLGSGSAYFGWGLADSAGNALVSGTPASAGVTDKLRVTLKVAVRDAIVNGIPYAGGAACSESSFSNNTAITPSYYNLTLVGRYYDNNGIDWVLINWRTRPANVNPVVKDGYPLPVTAMFGTYSWELYMWKIGANNASGNLNFDNDNQVEGVNGNVNEVNSAMYPAYYAPDDVSYANSCRDSRQPVTGGPTYPAGCCLRERYGSVSAGNCGNWMSGYRLSTLIEFNAPAHNLGEPGKSAMYMCEQYSSLSGMLSTTPYTGHEGDGTSSGRIVCTGCGLWSVVTLTESPGSTEYLFRNNYNLCLLGSLITYRMTNAHPNGGLGTIIFIGLIPDNNHVTGIMVGHRFGIHPFVAIVTSMPSGTYPALTPYTNWNLSFMQIWIYYLIQNLAYGLMVTADEWMNMHLRYPVSGEDNIASVNRVLTDAMRDLFLALDETLWLMEASRNNTLKPFILGNVAQLNDTKQILTLIRNNATLRTEFVNLIGLAFYRLPDIVGPPDASTGLNYLLKWRVDGLSYTEKRDISNIFYDLLDTLLSLIIAVMRHLPMLEYFNTTSSPGWNFNWISNSG
ncbi:MAG: hypothetical protein QXN49_07590 [Archaeoglobaceae archaeon]